MGAVKEQAIELMIKQDQSGDGFAFRMGMYAASHLILDERERFIREFSDPAGLAWEALSNVFENLLGAADFLKAVEALQGEPANGPVVD